MAIKNVIFDFGGVLLDWNPKYLFEKIIKDQKELDYFLAEVCTMDWNLEQDRGRLITDGTKILQQQFPEYHDLIQLYYDRWEQMIKSDIPANVGLLPLLKKKYKMYGLTNFSAETLPKAINRFQFFNVFDGIVVSGTEKLVKPDPAIYLLLLERYGIKAEESVFIDDNLANIHAAHALGIHTIHFHEEVNLEERLKELEVDCG